MNIFFESELLKIESYYIIKIPLSSSEELPSRGMVMVQGILNGISFKAPLEPDGKGSHWLEVSEELRKEAGLLVGQTVSLSVESINEWFEPEIPDDIMDAIMKEGLINQWNLITTKAHWEWLRWIRSTQNPQTRHHRIEVACDKLRKNAKRPCCFDASRCTVPDISKSGILME